MTSRYILDAVERCKLPIRVHCDDIGFIVAEELLPPPDSLYSISYEGDDPADATRAYLALCESLSSSPADSRAPCVASAEPAGASAPAHSSQSAAAPLPPPAATAVGAKPPGAVSRPCSGARA